MASSRRSVSHAMGTPRFLAIDARHGLLWTIVSPILVFLLLPTLLVIPMALTPSTLIEFPPQGISVRSFKDFFTDPLWTGAALSSLAVAAVAVSIAVVVGTTAAVALHGLSFRGRGLIVGVVLLPMVTPVVVLALGDFALFARFRLVGTNVGIGLAHSVLATPFVYVPVAVSLAGLNPELVRSARSLGANNISLVRHVYLPVMRFGIVAGALFALAVSLDEPVIALFMQGPDATTLPVKMFTDIQFELKPTIAAASSMLVAVAGVILLLQLALSRRRGTSPHAPGAPAVPRRGGS